MQLNPYLTFKGQCEEAFKFYERCFDGKITFLLKWADSPMVKDAPPEWGAKILHASLSVGNIVFAGGDTPPLAYERPRGFAVLLGLSDPVDHGAVARAVPIRSHLVNQRCQLAVQTHETREEAIGDDGGRARALGGNGLTRDERGGERGCDQCRGECSPAPPPSQPAISICV